ncbi:MAG: hypothetical protein KDB23_26120, partial [Planctomycetales bacterium]|nr:hypothetical protein [Planctomycetales bacterium]
GMSGLVQIVARWANNRRRGQVATWLLGMLVFFDDYANTLLLGSTLQPLCRKLRISREKLAYLVDSTAAPVAGLALISTWVAGEIDFVQSGLDAVQITGEPLSAFQLFVQSLAYRFYPLWTLVFVLLVSLTLRDFGPMFAAEQCVQSDPPRATNSPTALTLDEVQPSAWWNAVVPVLITVGTVLALLYQTGRDAAISPAQPNPTWLDIFGNANSYYSLLWGAFAGFVAALLLTIRERRLSWLQIEEAINGGARQMLPAIAVLWFASALSSLTGGEPLDRRPPPNPAAPYAARDYRLYTGDYLTTFFASTDADANASAPSRLAAWLPTWIFLLSAGVSFATGTSWGTMAIVMPIAIQLVIGARPGLAAAQWQHDPTLIATIGSVLAGSIFGDHCSPISDTTILSSQACGCDHMSHVWTQLPYAMCVGSISIVCGTIPIGFGWPIWAVLPLGTLCLLLPLIFFGRKTA